VAAEASFSVALDTELTESLLGEGLAREVVKAVQGLRRDADLDVSDRITLRWHSDDDGLSEVLVAHQDLIAGEVLAERIEQSDHPVGEPLSIDGIAISLSVSVAG
jgi:isoleucyl-tRNA synthetase